MDFKLRHLQLQQAVCRENSRVVVLLLVSTNPADSHVATNMLAFMGVVSMGAFASAQDRSHSHRLCL
jgi:hypothetical protein